MSFIPLEYLAPGMYQAQLTNKILNANGDKVLQKSFTWDFSVGDYLSNNLLDLTLSSEKSTIVVGESLQLNLLGTYENGSTLTLTPGLTWSLSDPDLAVIDASGMLSAVGQGVITVYATDENSNVISNTLSLQINAPVIIDTSNFIPTDFGTFYTDSIPPNATLDKYDETLFCMINGTILSEDGSPLQGVLVSIHSHDEYGSVLTNTSGNFAIPAEGGRTLTLVYEKAGYTTIHRSINAPTQDWITTPNVTMLQQDTKVTTIDFSAQGSQFHVSTPITDDRGTRSTTLVFDGITKATVTAKDGSTRDLTTIDVRATEFKTPESMPANLPIESAYTYCSDLKIDGVRDDEEVNFDAPVVMYVENFLGFDAGEIVPVGYYDRIQGKWVGSDNGAVVTLLDTDADGIVDALDSTGDGAPNDLDGDSVFSDEVIGLTGNPNYAVGQTLWRAAFTHFTPWDHNWPYGPPEDAEEPEDPDVDDDNPDDPCSIPVNSYVKPKTRVFHEDILIAGTDITLHYSSKRVDGYIYIIDASIDTTNAPSSVIGANAKLEIAGRTFIKEVSLSQLNNLQFKWDGRDVLGNKLSGEVKAKLHIAYQYELVYYTASSLWTQAWAKVGSGISAIRGRTDMDLRTTKNITIDVEHGANDIANGWSLSNHHKAGANAVYKGDGTKVEKEVDLTNELAAYYQFEGNANDSSFQANHAIAYGGVSYVDGLVGQAASFDGTGNIKTPIELTGINENQYLTLSFFGISNTAGQSVFISNSNYGDSSKSINFSASHVGIYSASNGICYSPYITINLISEIEDQTYCGAENYYQDIYDYGSQPVDYTQWHHYVISYDNQYERIYIDGNKVIEREVGSNMIGGTGPYSRTDSAYDRFLNIGRINNSFNYSSYKIYNSALVGKIDDLRIYKAALSDQKIQLLYNYVKNGNTNYQLDSVDISDGSFIYLFDLTGEHFATKDLYTKRVLEIFMYDNNNQLVTITDQFENTTTITRDSDGNPTVITAPNGQKTYLTVDANGDLSDVSYEDGSSYNFTYFTGSLMDKMTDPNSNETTHVFDENGRIIQETDAEGGTWSFDKLKETGFITYSTTQPEGEVRSSIDSQLADGSTFSEMTLISGDTLTTTRSQDGKQVASTRDGVESVKTFIVDPKNQQLVLASSSVVQPSGLTQDVTYTTSYEGNETHTDTKAQTISVNAKSMTILSDYVGGVQTITTPMGKKITREYDVNTRLTNSISSGGLTPTAFTYDVQGRVVSSTTGTRETSYTYDSRGNIATVTDPKDNVTSYSYDIMDRLTQVTHSNGTTDNYSYDNNGNMTLLITPT
ncbi:MAG: LamG-like jellyroll fold domain-containing protein, partial [Campylobacterota bacterium]